MWRFRFLTLVCVGWCALAAPARAQLSSRDIIRLLNEPMDVRDFQQEMTFKEFAGLLYEIIQRRGHELPLLVDKAGFQTDELPDFYEITVQFPPYPKTTTVMAALRLALAHSPVEATYLIRQGRIDIVPASRATLPHLLKQRITADFSRTPFTEVVHALSEMTGVSIQLDGRLPTKELPAVTAMFRNDMALRDVLHVIADLAGARVTELETGVVIGARGAGLTLRNNVSIHDALRTVADMCGLRLVELRPASMSPGCRVRWRKKCGRAASDGRNGANPRPI